MDAASFTLGAFFARRYLPTFLVGASQRTIVEYQTSIEKWAALTRDPALCECTVEDLASFKARLLEQPGRLHILVVLSQSLWGLGRGPCTWRSVL